MRRVLSATAASALFTDADAPTPLADLHHEPVAHPPSCARWPGTPGSWLAGNFLWVLVWTGACYWHGVGGFMFNSSSSSPRARCRARDGADGRRSL